MILDEEILVEFQKLMLKVWTKEQKERFGKLRQAS